MTITDAIIWIDTKAKEHEQLAEWLTDYKRLLALEDKIKSIVFSDSPDIAILKIKDIFTGENEE